MKNIFIAFSLIAFIVSSCNSNTTKEEKQSSSDSAQVSSTDTSKKATSAVTNNSNPIDELLLHYLALKNALVADDGSGAATHGKELMETLAKFDQSKLNDQQKKVFADMSDDCKEMAEHISTNAGKIAHQREHFDMMSTDIYDLVKVIKPQQPLYVDQCPKYNGGKGAIWLSETKDIKNPYMGKSMPTCGTVKEELKP